LKGTFFCSGIYCDLGNADSSRQISPRNNLQTLFAAPPMVPVENHPCENPHKWRLSNT
jgi:hypothetical protein